MARRRVVSLGKHLVQVEVFHDTKEFTFTFTVKMTPEMVTRMNEVAKKAQESAPPGTTNVPS